MNRRRFSVINLSVNNMPITLQSELRRISQEQFGQMAYDIMEVVFAVHNELGRFLEEDIYRAAIAGRLDNVQAGFAVYEDAAMHFYGGPEQVLGLADVRDKGRVIGCQPVRLAAPDIAFKITVMQPKTYAAFEDHARRFLAHSSLAALQWVNITHGQVLFKTLRRD
jgi:hypothetical protein